MIYYTRKVHSLQFALPTWHTGDQRIRSLGDGDLLGRLFRPSFRESNVKDAILHIGLDVFALYTSRKLESSRELAKAPLADGISVVLMVRRLCVFTRNGESVILDVELDLVLRETWKLKCSRYDILFVVFVEVHFWLQEPDGAITRSVAALNLPMVRHDWGSRLFEEAIQVVERFVEEDVRHLVDVSGCLNE